MCLAGLVENVIKYISLAKAPRGRRRCQRKVEMSGPMKAEAVSNCADCSLQRPGWWRRPASHRRAVARGRGAALGAKPQRTVFRAERAGAPGTDLLFGTRSPARARRRVDSLLTLRGSVVRERALVLGDLILPQLLENRREVLVVGNVLLPNLAGLS